MRKLGRALLAYSLIATMVVPQAYGLPAPQGAMLPAIKVTKALVTATNRAYFSAESALARLTPNIRPDMRAAFLNEKRLSMIKSGTRLANEVLNVQAMLILVSAISFRASQEHRELLALSNGQLPEGNSVQGDCTGGLLSSMLCSGEFWLGTIGGAAFMGANSLAGTLLRTFVKETSKRMAVFQLITSMASSSALMVGATSSSFLWTEAVKALPSPEMIQKANGVAGRALKAMASMNLTAFNQSEDGKIFASIMTNMWNIIYADSEMRSQWMYNTMRFGLLRGEFVVAIGTLMGASAASTAIIAAAGISFPFVGLVLTAALGFGGMYILLGAEAPTKITKMIQGIRSFSASTTMRRARGEIQALAYSAFALGRAGTDDERYLKVFDQTYLKERIDWLQDARESYANVAIEQFYELLTEQNKFSQMIDIAETAVRSEALKKNLFVEVNNEIMTFDQAKAKLCRDENRCDQSVANQIETLKNLRPLVTQSQQSLGSMVQALVNEYLYDAQMIKDMWASDATSFPVPVALRLSDFERRSQAVGESLAATLAGCDPVVSHKFGFDTTKEDNADKQIDLAGFYTQSFNEAKYYEKLQQENSTLAVGP